MPTQEPRITKTASTAAQVPILLPNRRRKRYSLPRDQEEGARGVRCLRRDLGSTGCLSNKTGYDLQARGRPLRETGRLDGYNQLPKIILGVGFADSGQAAPA